MPAMIVALIAIGGVPEAVNHKENGYIAEYKNQEDLVRGLRWLLNLNPEEIKTISLNCFKRVRDNFSLDLMVKNYLNLYQKVLDSRK